VEDKELPQSANGQGKGKRQGGKATASANTTVRICGVAKETQSYQAGSREAPPRTCALAGNVRRHQGDALAFPRARRLTSSSFKLLAIPSPITTLDDVA